jgi:hypothetical protein
MPIQFRSIIFRKRMDHQMIATKIALLESVVWDILVDRFNSTPNPVSTARQYAETKLPSRHGVKTAPDLEPTRSGLAGVFWFRDRGRANVWGAGRQAATAPENPRWLRGGRDEARRIAVDVAMLP